MIRGSWIKLYLTAIISILFSLANWTHSQNSKSDSLINLFNNSQTDNDKMRLASRIAHLNADSDSTSFLYYTNEVINLSEKLNN